MSEKTFTDRSGNEVSLVKDNTNSVIAVDRPDDSGEMHRYTAEIDWKGDLNVYHEIPGPDSGKTDSGKK